MKISMLTENGRGEKTGMLPVLKDIELVPVIELEPWTFSTRERSSPSGSGREMPQAWHRYWLDSLADSGVVGLTPIRPTSWLVRTQQLTNTATLTNILTTLVQKWGGPELFSDPDSRPVLNGGLALFGGGELLVTPTCCCDFGNLADYDCSM